MNENEVEMMLFQWHIREFGALPIAMSAGGKNYMRKKIDQMRFYEIGSITSKIP